MSESPLDHSHFEAISDDDGDADRLFAMYQMAAMRQSSPEVY